jgi:RNA polymerase sigma factor (sigma-70 family)
MSDDSEFDRLWDELRLGNESAASQLVQKYEAEIRRYIRYRLTDPRLKRIVDSLDICQSVFGRFFVHLANGELDLHNPRQLRALLLTMARNRLYDAARHEHAQVRDAWLVQAGDTALQGVDAGEETPSQIVSAAELVAAVRSELSDEDKHLISERLAGRQWADLARELGSTPEALRKRSERALDRAARALGLVEELAAE